MGKVHNTARNSSSSDAENRGKFQSVVIFIKQRWWAEPKILCSGSSEEMKHSLQMHVPLLDLPLPWADEHPKEATLMSWIVFSSLGTHDTVFGHKWVGHDSTATCPSQSPLGRNGLIGGCLVVHSESWTLGCLQQHGVFVIMQITWLHTPACKVKITTVLPPHKPMKWE